MFGIFKRKNSNSIRKCNHRWELLKETKEEKWSYNGIDHDIDEYDVVFCYCPKCSTRDKVSPLEWDLRKKQQEIDDNYTQEIIDEFKI